jgi:teichuronic acid biosynthesis glycosyltransferase TuaC
MKVLFVSSGNSGKASILVQRQAESLQKKNIDVTFFLIIGKGFFGYFKNILFLKKYLNNNPFDIIHGHYSLSAFVASIAGAYPLVVSLMGSDVKAGDYYKYLIRFFKKMFSWKGLIVKSNEMKTILELPDAVVIPNGVNIEQFKPASKESCRVELGWALDKTHILFAANSERPEKNFQLAKSSVELLDDSAVELHELDRVSPENMPIWYNASDVIVLSSLWEGSPNVIKEAMACNRPIVSTNVGDINWVFGNTPGCYLTSYSAEDVSGKLKRAINFGSVSAGTNGRERIIELGLDSETIANKLVEIYEGLISNRKIE